MSSYVLWMLSDEFEEFVGSGQMDKITDTHKRANVFTDFLEVAYEDGYGGWLAQSDFEDQLSIFLETFELASKKGIRGMKGLHNAILEFSDVVGRMENKKDRTLPVYKELFDFLTDNLRHQNEDDVSDLFGEICIVLSENPEGIREKARLKTMFNPGTY